MIQTFDFNELPVRVLMRDAETWFVAPDVCRVLEIANSRDAVGSLDDDEKSVASRSDSNVGNADSSLPNRGMQIISESGLYALIFKSRKAEAKRFRKWVTAEVLPAIRRTGEYMATEATVDVVSLFRFVREMCAGWSLERQMVFGTQVRRYAKSLGVVFQTAEEPGLGRVFVFPRPVLELVHRLHHREAPLPDAEAVEFERLLEALHGQSGDGRYEPDMVRAVARTMGLFSRIFTADSTPASVRSSFGRLCERYNGRAFPSGLSLCVDGVGVRRKYQITRRHPEALALSH